MTLARSCIFSAPHSTPLMSASDLANVIISQHKFYTSSSSSLPRSNLRMSPNFQKKPFLMWKLRHACDIEFFNLCDKERGGFIYPIKAFYYTPALKYVPARKAKLTKKMFAELIIFRLPSIIN